MREGSDTEGGVQIVGTGVEEAAGVQLAVDVAELVRISTPLVLFRCSLFRFVSLLVIVLVSCF